MLAATYRETGGSDVLTVGEVETPTPGAGSVRVRLIVAGVNPTDWKSRAGATAGLSFDFQVPGQDGAGVIDAVGSGVDEARVGERVWVYFAAYQRQWGTAAQYTVVPSEQAVPLPSSASFELGASLGIPALTAYHCLGADGPVRGRSVLVAGGAGAVGHAAIELAHWAGARVIATVSGEEKAALARAAGADAVVNYRDEDAAEQIRAAAPEGIDRIVELALGPNLELDLAVAARHAVISTYAADQATAEIPVRPLMAPNLVLRFVLVYTIPRTALRAAVDGVSQAAAVGALTTLPIHRFALEDVGAAHDAVESGVVGKVIIDLPDPG
jgi:NADPH2:quinone reductase